MKFPVCLLSNEPWFKQRRQRDNGEIPQEALILTLNNVMLLTTALSACIVLTGYTLHALSTHGSVYASNYRSLITSSRVQAYPFLVHYFVEEERNSWLGNWAELGAWCRPLTLASSSFGAFPSRGASMPLLNTNNSHSSNHWPVQALSWTQNTQRSSVVTGF